MKLCFCTICLEYIFCLIESSFDFEFLTLTDMMIIKFGSCVLKLCLAYIFLSCVKVSCDF